MIKLLRLVAVSVALASSAAAGPLEDGIDAYRHGNFPRAMALLRPIAEQGEARAQTYVGMMFEDGQGVPQDYAESIRFLRPAAEQGSAEAQNLLARMYAGGRGLPPNLVIAHMWFNLAIAQFVPGDTRNQAVAMRNVIAGRMNPEQIAEAQRLAREWRRLDRLPITDSPATRLPAPRAGTQ